MEDGGRQNDVTVLANLGVGVSTGYNQHRQHSTAAFSAHSKENLDSSMLIEVLLTRQTRRRSTTTFPTRRRVEV